MTSLKIWMDGHLVDQADATCSTLAHGLHYGTGVFEGIRAYATPDGPAIFRLEDHLARMQRGADLLGLAFDRARVSQACQDVLRANGMGDAYIRPLTFFAAGGLSLDVSALQSRTIVAALPWKTHCDEAGVPTHLSRYRRNPHTALPALKLCGGYVNAILAKREAMAKGFQEALFVDDAGYVVEATGENLFLVKHGRVIAVEHPDALPGITRATIIDLAGADSRMVHLSELEDADELFFTGTSAEVAPITRLDGRTLKPGPVTMDLRQLYLDVVHGRVPARRDWLTYAVEAEVGV